MARISSIKELEALYGQPAKAAIVKVADRITPEYRRLLAASPFAALATAGPEGLDCSPRGDGPGFVRVQDERTLLLPDRRGNNRVDSLRNIVRDPRLALMFLIPGCGNALRVNGSGWLETDAGMLESFSVGGQAPRSVLVIEVAEVYFQCGRAIIRSGLWDASRHVDPHSLPTPGRILEAMSEGRVGGQSYDQGWAARAAATLW